jgi:L-rhamnose mutarotase
MSRRLCLALDLVDDAALIADYEAYHSAGAVWREVIADIRASGIESMEIWRVQERCVMILEVSEDYPRVPPTKDREPVVRWNTLMARYQKPLPSAPPGEVWTPMGRLYHMPRLPE